MTAETGGLRRMSLAMFGAGFANFSILYCVQPLLPAFAQSFGLGAAQASLALSITTGIIAFGVLATSALSDAYGHRRLMIVSLIASALATLIAAAAPTWGGLVAARALIGVTMSAFLPAAMAYLAEETPPQSVGMAVGLYIGGSAFGGMLARMIAGVLAEFGSWRLSLAVVGAASLAAAALLPRLLPPAAHFTPRPLALRAAGEAFRDHLRSAFLRPLFLAGLLLMGAFVTIFNYVGFHLMEPPFLLGQAAVGMIFAVYPIGSLGSTWLGALAGRGRRERVFLLAVIVMAAGVAMTLANSLVAAVAGMAVMTFGFFGAHSIATSWVGVRATTARAQASSLYLAFYYLGSSLVGTLGGYCWDHGGWSGVVAATGAMIVGLLAIAGRMIQLETRRR
jgi:YNFM family putative membrane transporter